MGSMGGMGGMGGFAMDSFRSSDSDDELAGGGSGKKGYEFYYNQELRKMADDLKELEASGYQLDSLDRTNLKELEPAAPKQLRQDPHNSAAIDRKVRELLVRFEQLELRDLRRMIRSEAPKNQSRVPRWDFRRILCRALQMPFVIENEVLATQVFDLLSLDIDGTASWLQVIAALATLGQMGRGETLRLLLEICDANRDGWLHYDEVMAMLRAVAEGRMVDESALRLAMSEAGAVHIEDFYRWSGKEVLLEWIDTFSVQFETKLMRVRAGAANHPAIGSLHGGPGAVVAGTFESPYVAGASGDPSIDHALLGYLTRLAHGVRRPEDVQSAVRANNGKVGQPAGEVEMREVLLALLSGDQMAPQQLLPDLSDFSRIHSAQLQRIIIQEHGALRGPVIELGISRLLSALGVRAADQLASRFVRVVQHDSGRSNSVQWADVIVLILGLIWKDAPPGNEACTVVLQLCTDGHDRYSMKAVIELTSGVAGNCQRPQVHYSAHFELAAD